MWPFTRKILCQKFFTYRTNTIDLKGLSANVSSKINFKVGDLKIDPKFVKANEKLQQLDFLQYSTCITIKGIENKDKRDDLLGKLADIKMQMLFIAQNPDKADDVKVPELNNSTKINSVEIKDNNKSLIKLMNKNENVGKVLDIMNDKLPNDIVITQIRSEYNTLIEDIHSGIIDYSDTKWKKLYKRVLQTINYNNLK